MIIFKSKLKAKYFIQIRFRYQHVALIDLDEFIIPRFNNTLSDLLK